MIDIAKRAAVLVLTDRLEAHAVAEVDGPQFAPANSDRYYLQMDRNVEHAAYMRETVRQYLREKVFEEMMLGGRE